MNNYITRLERLEAAAPSKVEPLRVLRIIVDSDREPTSACGMESGAGRSPMIDRIPGEDAESFLQRVHRLLGWQEVETGA